MAFNFDKFESEFKQKRLFQSVAQLFGALRDPADQNARLLGVEPGDPLTQFMEQLRIGTEEPVAEFDFELGEPVTIETAGRLCRDRRVNGAPAPVNLPAMLVTAGQRLFFNTALQQPETYVEISRPEASDLPSEIAVCHFLDGAKTVIDWALSLPKLKLLAQERVYTARMAQQALHRLVSRFTPEHSHLVSDMTANEMANYLLRTETNRDKTAYRRKELLELVRRPDMELRAPLTTARRLIDIVYPANRAGTEMQRSTYWRMAIISFLPDEIAVPISERLKVANERCQPITDDELEAMAYQAEEVYRKKPPFPLKFGRDIGSIPVSAMIQFNSIDQELENRTTPNYGLPVVTGFGRQYQAYQPLPAMLDNNQALIQREAARQAQRAQQEAAALQEAIRVQQLLQEQQQQQNVNPEAEFLNQQLAALHRQEQEAAAALIPRVHETPRQQIPEPVPQTPARPPQNVQNPPILSPIQTLIRERAKRNLGGTEETARPETAAAAELPLEQRPLPRNLDDIVPYGDIDEKSLAINDRVFNRNGVPYVQKGGLTWRVILSEPEVERPASEIGTRSKTKTRKQKEEEERSQTDQEAELWSMNLQPSQNDRMSQLENQIECLAMSVKESMAAVKSLAKKGAAMDSTQPRAKTPSSDTYRPRGDSSKRNEAYRPRTESYKRGEVRDNRYTSKERNESSQTRNLSRDYARQDTSGKGYYASRQESRNRSYSASRQQQDRGRSFSSSRQERREQSRSPGRQNRNSALVPDRRSRRDDHSAQRNRERSYNTRQTYPKMRKGENCSIDYDPLKTKSCSKCTRGGHHEFECYKYERYNPKKCTVCDKLNHFAGDCKELERFPPKGKELNSIELGKNWEG